MIRTRNIKEDGKKSRLWAGIFQLLLAMLALTWSCTNEGHEFGFDGGAGKGLTLSFQVEDVSGMGVTKGITTRATVPASAEEKTVTTLYLFFFEATGDKSGRFIEYMKLDSPTSGQHLAIPDGSAITIAGAYNILAVVNIDQGIYLSGMSVDGWLSQFYGKTEAQAMADVTAYASEGVADANNHTDQRILPGALLMNGRTTKAADDANIDLALSRNVARFDVTRVPDGYTLASASVWNSYTATSVFGSGVMDYTAAGPRLSRFYGVTPPGSSGKIEGRLYAFENKSAAPKADDKLTTCLIVGLKPTGGGATAYYRINIAPEGNAQSLKRNNAYQVDIIGVNETGVASEAEAYAGGGSGLSYVINNWDLGENGIIVQDGVNILAVPTSLVSIGKDAITLEYAIYTHSGTGVDYPLSIKGTDGDVKSDDTGNIKASLSGNTLTVAATALDGEKERKGSLTLTYAGLEATVDVLQSESVGLYLTVQLPGGVELPSFPSVTGGNSGEINVKASGAWSATLVGDAGFSFNSDATTNTIERAADGNFQVYTISDNTDIEPREAYVIISLDADPINYAKVVALKQGARGSVNVSPASLVFDWQGGAKEVTVRITDVNGVAVTNWTATIEQGSSSQFSVTNSGDKAIVTALQNLSAATRTATLTIAGAGSTATVTLRQTGASYEFITPNDIFTPVSNKGGVTGAIQAGEDTGLKWRLDNITTSSNTIEGGYSIQNHHAYLVAEDGSTKITDSEIKPVSERFMIRFPMVYFPNREITGIKATVTIELYNADDTPTGVTQSLTVLQNPLTSAGVHIWNARPGFYGALGNTYFMGYTNAISSYTDSRGNGGTIRSNTSYVHFGTGNDQDLRSNYDWSAVENFRTSKDGIVMMVGDGYGSNPVAAVNNFLRNISAEYTVVGLGSLTGRTGDNATEMHINLQNTRVGQFLTTKGATPITSVTGFYIDGVHTQVTSWPTTAIPVVTTTSGRPLLLIDPTNKLIYLGESQLFWYHTSTYVSGGRGTFRDNFVQYVVNAAKYGEHFTSMMIDGNTGVPDPFGTEWNNNRWPVRK